MESTQNELEQSWLSWAQNVLVSEGSLRACSVCSSHDGTIFDRVLWPGFVGSQYVDGRVLLVGAVHNAAQLRTPSMERLAGFAETWALDRTIAADAAYLEMTRESYRKSSTETWIRDRQVWGLFRDLLTAFELSWDQVAFTNWSKCKSVTAGISPEERSWRYSAHIGTVTAFTDRLPIRELAPKAILVCCGDKRIVEEIRKQNLDVAVVRVFDQPSTYNGFRPSLKFPSKEVYSTWIASTKEAFMK